jgi:hypothetical protein
VGNGVSGRVEYLQLRHDRNCSRACIPVLYLRGSSLSVLKSKTNMFLLRSTGTSYVLCVLNVGTLLTPCTLINRIAYITCTLSRGGYMLWTAYLCDVLSACPAHVQASVSRRKSWPILVHVLYMASKRNAARKEEKKKKRCASIAPPFPPPAYPPMVQFISLPLIS